MKKLSEDIEKSLFAKMWDACSDMSRYAVMGFEPKIRELIFGNKWSGKPKCFIEIIDDIKEYNKEIERQNQEENKKLSIINMQEDLDSKKILDLIDGGKNRGFNENDSVDKYDGRFTPVIDFPNFLMHVLRICLEEYDDGRFQNIPLDEKTLLNDFGDQWNKEKVIKFIDVLLSCRYLFDKYVIKSSTLRSEDEHWSLWNIVKGSSNNYYYKNTFDSDKSESNDTEANEQTKDAIMLLSMFHVSNPSRIYKNWLYAVLRWLFDKKDDIEQSDYINFLEKLCDKFYFGNNCQGKDITEIILDKVEVEFELNSGSKENSNDKECWDRGVNVPNFIFNRLDYQLWQKNKDKYPKFRFTFRSSVEHHYPQHPSVGDELESGLNDFGNLYLLSQSKNSSLGNSSPEEKKKHYTNNEYDSLKQAIMMSYDKWTEVEIKDHGEKMIEILNQPLSKANS